MARVLLSVNLLCLVGAIIGVIAIFSTWITVGFMFWTNDMNLIDVFNQVDSSSDFWLPAVLCLIGVVVAFISPLGGIMQIIGVPLFISAFASHADGDLPSGIGAYLALVGAVVVLVSLLYPVGIGYRQRPVGILSRVLTFSPGGQT